VLRGRRYGIIVLNARKPTEVKLVTRKTVFMSTSLTFREEHRLRVFARRVLRKMFGRKKNEVTGEWRRVYNKEIYDLYFPPNVMWVIKSRRMRWTEHVAFMGGRIRVYRVFAGGNLGKQTTRTN